MTVFDNFVLVNIVLIRCPATEHLRKSWKIRVQVRKRVSVLSEQISFKFTSILGITDPSQAR